MIITGPENFTLAINDTRSYALLPQSKGQLSNKKKLPKLYIISHNRKPIYVGITTQPIKSRLRYGFSAVGVGGYYGYAWRRKYKEVELHLWFQKDGRNLTDIETIEAEVVYEIRNQLGQWPEQQTEIHFHQSEKIHREAARKISKYFMCKTMGV
jgi:hypothetical protein